MNLKGKVAIVTGGSRGIGRAIVLALASVGADVVINYKQNTDAAEKVLQEVEDTGSRGLLAQADIADYQACNNMVRETIDYFGRIDILINNAGVRRDNILATMKPQEWEEVITSNLTGVFNCTKSVIRPMLKQRSGGYIVNIASVVGLYGNAGQSNYAAAKAGVIAFTKSLARELGSRNITVNAIAPGFIETEMTEGLPEKVRENSLSRIVLNRFGKPEEIAELVLFIVSKGSYITGQVITIDGGLQL